MTRVMNLAMNAVKHRSPRRALILQLSLLPLLVLFVAAAGSYRRDERVLFHFKTDCGWKITRSETVNRYSLRFDSWRDETRFYLGPLVVFWYGPPDQERVTYQ